MANPQYVVSPNSDRPAPPKVAGPCPGARIHRHDISPNDVQDHVQAYYALDIHLSHPYHLEWKNGARYHRSWMVPGALCLVPAHESLSMRWGDHLQIISVQIDPFLMLQTAESMKLRGQLELPERHGDVDPQISSIAHALWAEAQSGYPTGRIFNESLVTALNARLLQAYTVQKLVAPQENKLAPRSWRSVRDFIEDHLDSDLGLTELAAIASLSPYHFARCFKETTGTTPHQYVIARRVERAKELLSKSPLSLAQIAAQCGFADQSHLTRQIKKIFGVTPASLQSLHQKGSSQKGRKNLQ